MAVYEQKSYEDMATRSARAIHGFMDLLVSVAGISRTEAATVFEVYRKIKVLNTRDQHVNGHITVKHGAFLDKDVILRALAQADITLKPRKSK